MQPRPSDSNPTSRVMEDLAIGALLSSQAHKAGGPEDSFPQIEFVSEDELPPLDDLACTGRFVRWSAPYERIELDTESMTPLPRPSHRSRFARTTTRPNINTVDTVRAPKVTIEAALAEFTQTAASIPSIASIPTIGITTAPSLSSIPSLAPSRPSLTPVEKLASTTMSSWFQADASGELGGSFEDLPAVTPMWASWRWLAISLAVAAAVLVAAQLVL